MFRIVMFWTMSWVLLFAAQPAAAQADIPFSQIEIESAPEYELEFLRKALGFDSTEMLLDELLGISYDAAAGESESENKQRESSPQPVESISRIDIQHADNIQYITAEERGIVIFSGGVRLLYVQNGRETAFHADYVLYDESAGMIAASGDVQLERQNSEAFSSSILFYNLKTAQGLTFHAETDYTLLEEAESRAIRIQGETIEFSSDSSLHIRNGTITAAGDETYLSIKADALHLLKDGDWSVSNAVLYIGNIPVFYAPIFFYPGKRMITNPVAGIDEERGLFLQNTFYLKGTPDISADSDSLFSKSISDEANAAWLQDKYSRSYTVFSSDSSAAASDHFTENSDYFKLYWDVYADPEIHAGFDLFNEKRGVLKDASLKGGITIGRNRFPRLGEDFPVGAYLDAAGTLKTDMAAVTIRLPYYSDQFLARDMLNRFEKFNIRNFFSPVEWNTAYTRMHNLEWSVKTDMEKIPFGKNRAQVLQIDDADAFLLWTQDASDSDRNYIPYKIVFPAVSYSLKGPLFSFSHEDSGTDDQAENRKASENGAEAVTGDIMLEPDVFSGEKHETAQQDPGQSAAIERGRHELFLQKDFPLPEVLNSSSAESWELFSFSSHYQLSHDFSMYTLYSEEPRVYSANSSVQSSVVLKNSILDNFVTADLRIIPKWNAALRAREDGMPMDELEAAERDSSYLQTAGELSAALPKLNTTYSLKADLYKNYYLNEQYDVHTFSFSEDSVTEHRITYKMKNDLHYKGFSSLFTAAAQLPPLTPELSLSETVSSKSASVMVKTAFSESEADKRWNFSALTASLKYKNAFFSAENRYFLNAEDRYFSNEADMQFKLFQNAVVLSAEADITDKDRNAAELDEMVLAVSAENTSLTLISGMHEADDENASRSFLIEHCILDSSIHLEAGTGNEAGSEKGSSSAQGTRLSSASGLFDLYWDLNFIEPDDSLFKFRTEIYFEVEDFITIGFKSVSSNKRIGSYMNPASNDQSSAVLFMKEFFGSLAKSFNFFNRQDRLESDFNIESYAVDIVHIMPDWDFHLQVDGKLALENRAWVWDPKLSVFLEWKIMPEIKLDKDIDF